MQSLAIARQTHNTLSEAEALAALGKAYMSLGDKSKGRKSMQDALAIFERLDVPGSVEVIKQWLKEI